MTPVLNGTSNSTGGPALAPAPPLAASTTELSAAAGLPSYLPTKYPLAQLDSVVNVTREYPFDLALIMFGYLLPVVLLVTFVTNLLVVAVLYQNHMRTPTNIVLFAMAIVDMATLLSPSPWYLYIYTFGNHTKFLYPPIACYTHHIMTDVVPVFFHTSSIWLALLLASQRYIYVCHPTLAKTWCTVPRVKRAILVILGVAFLHQLSRFFDNTFVPVQVEFNNTTVMACKNEIADWVRTVNVALFYATYFIFRILFVFIIPCSALITLNFLLFRALKRAETKRTQLLKTRFKIVGVNASGGGGGGAGASANAAAGSENSQAERNSHQNVSGANYAARTDTPRYVLSRASPAEVAARGGFALMGQRRLQRATQALPRQATSNEEELDEDNDEPTTTTASGQPIDATGGRLSGGGSGASNREQADSVLSMIGKRPLNLAAKKANELIRAASGGHTNPKSNGVELTEGQARESALKNGNTNSTNNNNNSDSNSTQNSRPRSTRSGRSDSDSNGSDTGSAASSTTTKTEDLSTCPECAAYELEMQRTCWRCSLSGPEVDGGAGAGGGVGGNNNNTTTTTTVSGGNATITSCEHHRQTFHRHLLHRQMSQCSSILGGATNEEDMSSCLNTQNISSSMFVPNAIDGIETSSMRGVEDEGDDDDGGGDGEHTSLSNRGSHPSDDAGARLSKVGQAAAAAALAHRKSIHPTRLAQFKAGSSNSGQLIKSGSVDSRLACGCLAAKVMALRRVRSLGKQKSVSPFDKRRLPSSLWSGHSCSLLGDSSAQLEHLHSSQGIGRTDKEEEEEEQRQQQVLAGGDEDDNVDSGERPEQDQQSKWFQEGTHSAESRGLTLSDLPGPGATQPRTKGSVGSLSTGVDCDSERVAPPAKTATTGLANSPGLKRTEFRLERGNSVKVSTSVSSASALQTGAIYSTTGTKSATAGDSASLPPGANNTVSATSATAPPVASAPSDTCALRPTATKARSDYQIPAAAASQARTPSLSQYNSNINNNSNSSSNNNNNNNNSSTNQLVQHQQRTKSPSFAGCTTGRGSRATLLGGPVPVYLSSGQSNPSNHIQAMVPVSARSIDSNRTTLMLVVVVTVFLFVEVPVALMTISHVILNAFDVFEGFNFDNYLDHIKLFTNFMIMISYSVNFTIYCSMSKRFRETFRDLLRDFFRCGRASARKRTKRIFSQSQAPTAQQQQHCAHTNQQSQFVAPVSTVVTSAGTNNNTNNSTNNNNTKPNSQNQNHTSSSNSNNNNNRFCGFGINSTNNMSRQFGESALGAAGGSRQNLLTATTNLTRRTGGSNTANQSECEL